MRKTRGNKKQIYVYATIIALFFTLIFLGRGIRNVYQQNRVASNQQKELLKELEELEKRKDDLEALIISMQTKRGLEEEIRNKFQVSRPGEETVILIDEEEVGDQEESTRSLWSRIVDFFSRN